MATPQLGTSLRQGGVSLQKQDTQIEKPDQEKINQFSRLNMKVHELRADIKTLKEEITNLEDATEIVEESFGEGLKLFVGECLVTVNEDQANNYVEKLRDEKQEELDSKNDQLDDIESNLKDLKSYLYARFGSSINLEEETEWDYSAYINDKKVSCKIIMRFYS